MEENDRLQLIEPGDAHPSQVEKKIAAAVAQFERDITVMAAGHKRALTWMAKRARRDLGLS